VLATALSAGGAGCRRGSSGSGDGTSARRKAPPAAEALQPAFFAGAIRKIGGAHYHATARFVVGAPGGTENAVTTTTDVWVDRAGNYRIREDNDRDGGREVVLYGRELAIALRYGRMIRRVAEEPEPAQLLEEALGAPWAAFELIAPGARTTDAGSELMGGAPASVVELALADGQPSGLPAPGAAAFSGMRTWRGTVALRTLSGRIVLDDATGALAKADISATFAGKSENNPIQGSLEVHAVLSDIANTPAIERPPAEELVLRQRILPEQRELLRGLSSTAEPLLRRPSEGAGNNHNNSTASPHAGGRKQ
jgi:hypothetical protein